MWTNQRVRYRLGGAVGRTVVVDQYRRGASVLHRGNRDPGTGDGIVNVIKEAPGGPEHLPQTLLLGFLIVHGIKEEPSKDGPHIMSGGKAGSTEASS